MFILTLFLKVDDEASVTRTPNSMIAFSPPPPPQPSLLLSTVVVISVGQVRELWPLFPHCEQLRDIFFFPSQKPRDRDIFGMTKGKDERRREEKRGLGLL